MHPKNILEFYKVTILKTTEDDIKINSIIYKIKIQYTDLNQQIEGINNKTFEFSISGLRANLKKLIYLSQFLKTNFDSSHPILSITANDLNIVWTDDFLNNKKM